MSLESRLPSLLKQGSISQDSCWEGDEGALHVCVRENHPALSIAYDIVLLWLLWNTDFHVMGLVSQTRGYQLIRAVQEVVPLLHTSFVLSQHGHIAELSNKTSENTQRKYVRTLRNFHLQNKSCFSVYYRYLNSLLIILHCDDLSVIVRSL
jgi:hypothetical protein